MAATREDACDVDSWTPLSVSDSLGILLSVLPGGHKRAVDCTLAAHNCQEVEACSAYYLIDEKARDAELHLLPECGSERTDHCEGNVAKYCENDNDGTLYQASYDCTLAGATCIVTEAAGERYADCQAPQLQQCEGDETQYCDGTRGHLQRNHDWSSQPLDSRLRRRLRLTLRRNRGH